MDVTFNNVLEGTRQYFMGLPTATSQGGGVGGGHLQLEEAVSATSSHPPTENPAPLPPRPPSEPLEPEPHIIHKATVMREALEKRRECPEPEDEDEAVAALSPPSHIIRKPPHALPSPASALAAPCPSPARPPSTAAAASRRSPVPTPPHVRTPTPRRTRSPDSQPEPPPPRGSSSPYQHQYHTQLAAAAVSPARDAYPAARPPDHYTGGRPPDPYSISRPPETTYSRYHYDTHPTDTRSALLPGHSPQPGTSLSRHSPQQTYSRLSNAIPQHASAVRMREGAAPSPPAQRYGVNAPASAPAPPHNDRVPPIHHPSPSAPPVAPRVVQPDSRSNHPFVDHRITTHRVVHEHSPFARPSPHYERHSTTMPRKHDSQQAYPGYRPPPTTAPPLQTVHNLRFETQQQFPLQYKHLVDTSSAHYPSRPPERPQQPDQTRSHDAARLPPRVDYPNLSRPDRPAREELITRHQPRNSYAHVTPSTSTARCGHNSPVTAVPNSLSSVQQRNIYRSESSVKPNQDYSSPNHIVQSSSTRSTMKTGYPTQQSRMTVSVTTLVNQMNQTKHKRESPLDLSVKTVKNTADSSTTQEEVEPISNENKSISLPPRASASTRQVSGSVPGYVSSHKVDFAPDFHSQYRDRIIQAQKSSTVAHAAPRCNGSYSSAQPVVDPYRADPRQQHSDRGKYVTSASRYKYPVSRIDLTRPAGDERPGESRPRDDRNFIIEDSRKRLGGPVVSNIPEKIVRYETWSADSRIDRMSWSAREQHELMSRPVYSYSSHKRLETVHSEHKRSSQSVPYKDISAQSNTHSHHRYPVEPSSRDANNYHSHYAERGQQNNLRQVIQKIPSHKDIPSHHYDHRSGVPADKRVLSILRNSLETKHTGYVEAPRPARQIPDLIVIDDVDDSVIEITDLTKDTESDVANKVTLDFVQRHPPSAMARKIHIPKAVDSMTNEIDCQKIENNGDVKSTSPENDVASRIRTKAELKVLPPSQESTLHVDIKHEITPEKIRLGERIKVTPKSQKQHLFNQIREDKLRLESVIKTDRRLSSNITEIKSEPMNIDEIEKDAEITIKTENCLEPICSESLNNVDFQEDMDWANACEVFMEQLKAGSHKKKKKRRTDTDNDDNKSEEPSQSNCSESSKSSCLELAQETSISNVFVGSVPSMKLNATVESVSTAKSIQAVESVSTVVSAAAVESVLTLEPVPTIESTPNLVSIPRIKQEPADEEYEKNESSQGDTNCPNKSSEQVTTSSKSVHTREFSQNDNEILPVRDIKKEVADLFETPNKPIIQIKEESESTDDDEPLIKSKLLKEREKNEQRLKYQLLKDLSQKSAYVKLECCDADLNRSVKLDTLSKEHDGLNKDNKLSTRSKSKSIERKGGKQMDNTTSDSDDDVSVACRLRTRKCLKSEDGKITTTHKTPNKSSPAKKHDNASNNSTPIRKTGFGDGSNFHPGWEEELYRYKRSLRMPTRLIAIPRGRSGGPFVHGSSTAITRGSTSLPDLDPAPLSPAPSSAPSAATDDIFARRPDKLTLDSDLESNSSCSAPNRLHYDSEASTSTVFSTKTKPKRKGESILDVLIQKYGKKEDAKKKTKEDIKHKVTPKTSITSDILPTPNPDALKNHCKGVLSAKKEKLMEDIFGDSYMNNTTDLKPKEKLDNKILKQRKSIKEVFGDERPASAPPISCSDDRSRAKENMKNDTSKCKKKLKKNVKDEPKRKNSTIRDGLRSTKSLKRNDAKGRLLRLKKRNHIMRSLANKKMKEVNNRQRKEQKSPNSDGNQANMSKENTESLVPHEGIKRRYKRLFGRRKFSSGFDYIRKKKKITRDDGTRRVRKAVPKPSPESVHDIHKEIKGWFINKSIGETSLHRAARLGYMDCVAYCLEKLAVDPSSRDNAGFTPLHVAASRGHVRIARLLLQYGANVSAAAQGGIRPLHEACENCHIEMIRLLLAYGADPLLGTYSGQMPAELAEGSAARWLRLHIADVQGQSVEPWRFHPPAHIIDFEEMGCDSLSSPPPASPPPVESTLEIQCTEAPLPPFYSLRAPSGQPTDGLWCLMQDLVSLLQIKSKDSLLKQIHCGSGSPKELLRELRTQEFLERAQCHQLLGAGEKVNVRASKVALVRVTDKLRQLLNIETVLVS